MPKINSIIMRMIMKMKIDYLWLKYRKWMMWPCYWIIMTFGIYDTKKIGICLNRGVDELSSDIKVGNNRKLFFVRRHFKIIIC
jgi:hypothetical protein